MGNHPKSIDEVFWIYGEARVGLCDGSVWTRFDHEFVRVMNAKNISAVDLAKSIGVNWRILNSPADRGKEPKWMTPLVVSAMTGEGFDVMYILTGQHPITLTPNEAALLDNYRILSPDGKTTVGKTCATLAQPKPIENVNQRNK